MLSTMLGWNHEQYRYNYCPYKLPVQRDKQTGINNAMYNLIIITI